MTRVTQARGARHDLLAPTRAGSHYSVDCLEIDEWSPGNRSVPTPANSVASPKQLRERHPGPQVVIRDNGPAHGGDAGRDYLSTPDPVSRVPCLPACRPDCSPDEATANTCLGTMPQVWEKLVHFFADLTTRTAEVQSCRRKLPTRTEALPVP